LNREKRPALPHQPDLYLEPKWLRYQSLWAGCQDSKNQPLSLQSLRPISGPLRRGSCHQTARGTADGATHADTHTHRHTHRHTHTGTHRHTPKQTNTTYPFQKYHHFRFQGVVITAFTS